MLLTQDSLYKQISCVKQGFIFLLIIKARLALRASFKATMHP